MNLALTPLEKETPVAQRLLILLLVLLVASLPYERKVSSFLLLAATGSWCFTRGPKNLGAAFRKPELTLIVSFFLLAVVGLLYSENKDFSLLEKRMSLVLVPILIFSSSLSRKSLAWMLGAFVLSCFLGSSFALLHTFMFGEAFDTNMTLRAFGITHVYFSLFVAWAVMVLTTVLVAREKHYYDSLILLALIGFFLFFIFLLGGKMAILAILILAVAVSVRFMMKAGRRIIGLILLIIPLTLFAIAITQVDQVKSRFSYLFNKEHYFVGDNAWTSIGVRLTILKCAYSTFDRPIIGTGSGDVQNDLDACYDASGYPSVKTMNAHNQYFQFLLSNGAIGLSFFIFFLVFSFAKAQRRRNLLAIAFLSLFALCCITESLLERQQGIMFFALFLSISWCYGHPIADPRFAEN